MEKIPLRGIDTKALLALLFMGLIGISITGSISGHGKEITSDKARIMIEQGQSIDGLIVNGDLDMSRMALGSIHSNGTTFRGCANFEGATFKGEAWFIGSTFLKDAMFDESTFYKDATFQDAEFNRSHISFPGIKFLGNVSFIHAQLTVSNNYPVIDFSRTNFGGKSANFNYVNFYGELINFNDVDFSRCHASFSNATFLAPSGDSWTNFRYANFSGGSDFRWCDFSTDSICFEEANFLGEDIFFNEASFGGDANFERARFNGKETSFSKARFSGGDADFSSAEFNGSSILFDGAEFYRGSSFKGARLNGTDISFSDVGFNGGKADFSEAEFNGGPAIFDRADFSRANFSGAKFMGGSTSFQETKFLGNTIFSGANFDKDAYFSDAQFRGYSDFNCSTFKGDALFEGANFGSKLSLIRTRYNKMFITWHNITHALVYHDTAYLSLMKNFKDLGYLEDFDYCYLEYRRGHRNQPWPSVGYVEADFRKIIDLFLDWSYCYGIDALRPVRCSLGIITIFGFLFSLLFSDYLFDGRNYSLKRRTYLFLRILTDSFILSLTAFLSGTKLFVEPPKINRNCPGTLKILVYIERLLGMIFSILFFIALSWTVVRLL